MSGSMGNVGVIAWREFRAFFQSPLAYAFVALFLVGTQIFYVLTALAGAVVFVFLTVQLDLEATLAALITIVATFVFRVLTIVFNWRTTPVGNPADSDVTP